MQNGTAGETRRWESFSVAALLALAGGLLDAYSYLFRGGVFANAETGNMVLMGIRLMEGDWRTALGYLIPILAFTLGILVAELLRHREPAKRGWFHWRQHVLLVEILVVTVAAFLPQGGLNSTVNSMVAFVCALQVESFRTVRGNPYASTMCTGNLRSGTEALYYALAEKDRASLRRGGCYFAVIALFICGAASGVGLCARLGQYAVLAAAGLQLAAWLLMIEKDRPA